MNVQEEYEDYVRGLAKRLQSTDEFGLAYKLSIFSYFLRRQQEFGENAWSGEPLLYYFLKSVEVDLHLAIARLLDEHKQTHGSIRKFLNFTIEHRAQIKWAGEGFAESELFAQKQKINAHEETIKSILGRRNKYFAHPDRKYFHDPAQLYTDFPIDEDDLVALASELIMITVSHDAALTGGRASGNLWQFVEVAADNMIRNLETGRAINFPPAQNNKPD